MANRIEPSVKSKLDSRAIARIWMQDGFSPVPLGEQSKRPKGGEGWNKLRVTEDTVDKHFHNGDNVGILWGAASNWIIDIDLDWDESVAVARRILPKTKTYGRDTRPRSHYLYRCQNAKGGKWTSPPKNNKTEDEGISVIVELRSTGSQSVVPPSLHPDGDRYQFNDDIEYTEITPRSLEKILGRVAAASLLARHYPISGARHDYVCAITGTLLHLNWSDDLVTDFVWAVLDACETETDRPQRERTITNTIQHFRAGDNVYGFKMLSQWLEPGVVDRLRRWLEKDLRYTLSFSPIVANPVAESTKEPIIQPRLTDVPGLVGDIAKWASQRAYVKQPVFDMAAGIMSVALLSGNRYIVDSWDTPLQPYLMVMAPTACGKESALNSVATLARKAELEQHVFQGFQSYHALLDQLLKPPNMACWLWDEAGRKLRQAGRSVGSPENNVVTWLLSLYGKANSYSPAFPGRQQTIPTVDHPFMLTMAASQPQVLVDAINSSDLSTGLINRFILFDAGDTPPDDNVQRTDLFPAKLLDRIREFKTVEPPTGDSPFIRIPFDSTPSYNLFRDFQTESRKRAAQEGSNEMWGRATQNALILAGVVAVGISPRAPQITVEIGNWAIDISRWSFLRWSERLVALKSRSMSEEHSKEVERYIMNSRSYVDKFNNRPRMAKLLEEGLMPRTALVRLARNLNSRQLEDVLKNLQDAELIDIGERNGAEVYWSK